jgi:hypothetical protein
VGNIHRLRGADRPTYQTETSAGRRVEAELREGTMSTTIGRQLDYNHPADYQAQANAYAQPPRLTAKEAGENLARLMERQLGYPEGHFDNVALRLFIRAYWSRVSTYAHAIHNEP